MDALYVSGMTALNMLTAFPSLSAAQKNTY